MLLMLYVVAPALWLFFQFVHIVAGAID